LVDFDEGLGFEGWELAFGIVDAMPSMALECG
jgi:hypothetical protein